MKFNVTVVRTQKIIHSVEFTVDAENRNKARRIVKEQIEGTCLKERLFIKDNLVEGHGDKFSYFTFEYDHDVGMQRTADSWPNSIGDSRARDHWGWESIITLNEMVRHIFEEAQREMEFKVRSKT